MSLAGNPGWGQQPSRPAGDDASQIAPLRFTGYEGYVLTSYLRDDNDTVIGPHELALGSATNQTVSRLRTEIFLLMHGYAYLPGLLSLDLGAGPVVDWSSYAASDGTTRSTKALYNLSLRASVLRDKPYRGTVYFEHLNPSQSVGPAQVMLTESERYGVDLALREPATTVPLRLEASRSRQQGRSTEQTLDDRIDQASLRADGRIGKLGDTQLHFRSARQESLSGSTGLPVQATRSDSDGATLDTRLRFGALRQYDLDNNIAFNSQRFSTPHGDAIAQNRDYRFALNLGAVHSQEWQSNGRYVLSGARVDSQSTTVNALSGGTTWRPFADTFATLTGDADITRTTQLDASRGAMSASATHQRDLAGGKASATYSYAFSRRDQQAKAGEAAVVGERLMLTGTALVALRNPQVVTGSVVVSNLSRTQVYAEGVDYLLSALGLAARIQRVVGGNIVDGQELLVDYAFDVGGTYALSQTDHSLNLNWAYQSYLSVFYRFQDSAPRLQSGAPTFDLNPVRATLLGARADVPLAWTATDLQLGGAIEREDRREAISPYERTLQEVYLQAPVPFTERSHIRIGARRSRVDYDNSPEQAVRLVAYDVRLWAQPFYGFDFSVDASRERDTGAAVARERRFLAARATWRVRQFRMNFDLTHTDESQAGTQRKRLYAQLVLRRDF